MEASRELLFFFSALGAFNGLLLGLFFFFLAKPKNISNYFLSALLLVLSIRIGKSVFFYFNPDLASEFIHFGLVACAFIGPSLYFYIKSVVNPEKLKATWKIHYLLIFLLIVPVSLRFPYWEYLNLWWTIIDLIYLGWGIYLICAAFLLRPIFKQFTHQYFALENEKIWVLSIFVGNVVIWSAYVFCAYTSYITGALSFSFILYLWVLIFIFYKKNNPLFIKKSNSYLDKKITQKEAIQLSNQLKKLMLQEKLYKNPSIKLPDVAKALEVTPHRLSQFLNDNLGQNFPLFINQYRIREAQGLIQTQTNFSMEGIGYECGFKSKSTFYTTFKKMTGMTPAEFRNKQLN